jgi:hypothetical protein
LTTFAQEDKSVTLVVNGEGKTADDAKQSALRNAIEQAFGTFISSKTDILNDQLIKDEIVSVSNGNIQKFEVLSEGKLPDGSYYNTLKATVSVSKLTSFCESKGISVEFKGSLFSFNIKQQKINEENELKAIQDMSVMLKKIIDKSFDFKIDASQPSVIDNSSGNLWKVPFKIGVSANDNFFKLPKLLSRTLSGLSLTTKEVEDYVNLGKDVYTVLLATEEINDGQYYFLRNEESIFILYDIFFYFKNPILSARVKALSPNGVSFKERLIGLANLIRDDNIRLNRNPLETDFLGRGEYLGIRFNEERFNPLYNYNILNPYGENKTGKDKYTRNTSIHSYLKDCMNLNKVTSLPYFQFDQEMSDNLKYVYRSKNYSFLPQLYVELVGLKTRFHAPSLISSFLQIRKNDYELITISGNLVGTTDEIGQINEIKVIPGTE